jgi:hypothetical protein
MLEGKTRIPPVNVETRPDDLRETLEEQRKLWGAPLYPYLFYARNPAYFRAAITDTRRDVDDELFARLQRHYDDDTIAELTMIIAWQNASSRFNRAFRIPSQGFWKR